MPTIITNRHDVFVCTLLYHELYNNANTYVGQTDFQLRSLQYSCFLMLTLSLQAPILIINRLLEGKDRLI